MTTVSAGTDLVRGRRAGAAGPLRGEAELSWRGDPAAPVYPAADRNGSPPGEPTLTERFTSARKITVTTLRLDATTATTYQAFLKLMRVWTAVLALAAEDVMPL